MHLMLHLEAVLYPEERACPEPPACRGHGSEDLGCWLEPRPRGFLLWEQLRGHQVYILLTVAVSRASGHLQELDWLLKKFFTGNLAGSSAFASHVFHVQDIPENIDILVTHDAPQGIFDSVGGGHWGSSQQLRQAIFRSQAKAWACWGPEMPAGPPLWAHPRAAGPLAEDSERIRGRRDLSAEP